MPVYAFPELLDGASPELKKRMQGIPDKTIVFTDAEFNVGCAIGAAQTLPPGVYIAMNGRVYEAERVRKNYEVRQFEEIGD